MPGSNKDYLTRRQKEILDFIRDFRVEHGISPTHLEIRRRFGYSSYGTVYKHLKLLEEKGFLARDRNQKRGIALAPARAARGLAERSGDPAATDGRRQRGSGAEGGFSGDPTPLREPELELPFFGRIAAGRPIETVPGDETIGVPAHLLGSRRNGDHYVLRVAGDSMIDEGIYDGDFVVVQLREHAEAGEMVVALVGEEATLKHFFPEGERVRLQPANPHMEPIYVAAREVKIQGIVVGLMRRF